LNQLAQLAEQGIFLRLASIANNDVLSFAFGRLVRTRIGGGKILSAHHRIIAALLAFDSSEVLGDQRNLVLPIRRCSPICSYLTYDRRMLVQKTINFINNRELYWILICDSLNGTIVITPEELPNYHCGTERSSHEKNGAVEQSASNG
jgi:hypothetical protein